LIQKEIVNQLSKKILAGHIDRTSPVLVDVFDGIVVFRNEHHEPKQTPEEPAGGRKGREKKAAS
jgi:ATP-dependent Clp protease ATP-binding subunit ClpB